jgi:hypothetical protein
MKATKNFDRSKMLNARTATIIFLTFYAAQIIFCFLSDGLASLITNSNRIDGTGQNNQVSTLAGKIADVGSPFVGAVVMIALANLLISDKIKETSPTGAAWTLGKSKDFGKGLIVGISAAIFSLVLDLIKQPRLPYSHLTPVQQMGATPGLQQLLFILEGY